MAKKVVATLKKEGIGKNHTRVIKMIKNPLTGAYGFKEDVIQNDAIKDFLEK